MKGKLVSVPFEFQQDLCALFELREKVCLSSKANHAVVWSKMANKRKCRKLSLEALHVEYE